MVYLLVGSFRGGFRKVAAELVDELTLSHLFLLLLLLILEVLNDALLSLGVVGVKEVQVLLEAIEGLDQHGLDLIVGSINVRNL